MKTNTIDNRRAWGDAKSLYGRRVEFTYGGSHEKVNGFIGGTSQEETAPNHYLYELELFGHMDDPYELDDDWLTWEELSTLKATGEVTTSFGHWKLLDD